MPDTVAAEAASREQRLREEIEELQVANSMLADFESLVSHDMQGALRRIMSFAELLTLRPALNGEPAAHSALHIIIAAARTIDSLANNTLVPAAELFISAMPASRLPRPSERTVAELECRLRDLRGANHELTELADSVARDFRTPLARILSATEHFSTLPAVTAKAVCLDIAGKILADARRIAHLIDDYLCFVNAGRNAIQYSRVCLESLVQLVRHELEPMCSGRKVTWRIGALPEVEGDPRMLRQAILNLLSNSLKYTRGRPQTIIEIGVRPDASEHIVFIRDNGLGFDAESARKLFQKYGRLPGDKNFEGTGIGLLIVRYIIQRHRGRVWAESTPGAGATFCFTLPVEVKNASTVRSSH